MDRDSKRLKLNDESKSWATRQHLNWTSEEDDVILGEWIQVRSANRDEEGISRRLKRTVYSCQARAETLRRMLGLTVSSSSRPLRGSRSVCSGCFMEMPASGICECE